MKLTLKFATCILLTGILTHVSCKKEYSCVNGWGINKAPIAFAGKDTAIVLPVDSVILDGSGSTDADSSITNYVWTKISGPSSFNIANANAVQTQVTDLVQGIYQFELRVTDTAGFFSKDTIQVTVKAMIISTNNGILIPFGTLSIARGSIASGTAGNKILFAGGCTTCGTIGSPICNWYSRVDIYDINTLTWSTAELSEARIYMGVATLGNKIFFAGGYNSGDNATSRVDIYDAVANVWSTAELSQARINPAAASAGNKIFFGGGCPLNGGICETPTSRVDVYDAVTNSWSTIELSGTGTSLAAVSVGNKVLFAGSMGNNSSSNRVDLYNTFTSQWTTDTLSEARGGVTGASLNNKAFFAGGFTALGNTPVYSDKVDIYDNANQSWTTANLSQPAAFSGAASQSNLILFFPYGTRMEIYKSASNNWYFSDLNQPLYSSSVVGAGGHIYVAGGALNSTYINYTSQVWRVQF